MNFRPSSLLSVLLKLINLMIKERIITIFGQSNAIPHRSYTYFKHKSASMMLNQLKHEVSYELDFLSYLEEEWPLGMRQSLSLMDFHKEIVSALVSLIQTQPNFILNFKAIKHQ